ncbi:hypothetical protein EV360DRAFT_71574 [Lentinula raphanica]|nr:hypothetical protein EV360DRAFT_71574 [Lentinula raphanica]
MYFIKRHTAHIIVVFLGFVSITLGAPTKAPQFVKVKFTGERKPKNFDEDVIMEKIAVQTLLYHLGSKLPGKPQLTVDSLTGWFGHPEVDPANDNRIMFTAFLDGLSGSNLDTRNGKYPGSFKFYHGESPNEDVQFMTGEVRDPKGNPIVTINEAKDGKTSKVVP